MCESQSMSSALVRDICNTQGRLLAIMLLTMLLKDIPEPSLLGLFSMHTGRVSELTQLAGAYLKSALARLQQAKTVEARLNPKKHVVIWMIHVYNR